MMDERRVMQEALFYGFSLERRVPDNHILRRIDRFVDLSEVRAHLGPYYSDVGRPSTDPELLARMLLVGYCFGIRSERRLCEEVHLNLDIRLVFPSGNEKTRPEAASAQLSIGVKSGSPLAIARRYAGRSPMRCR
jgi:transposase